MWTPKFQWQSVSQMCPSFIYTYRAVFTLYCWTGRFVNRSHGPQSLRHLLSGSSCGLPNPGGALLQTSLEFNSRASWYNILWSVTLQVPLNFTLTYISIKYIIHVGGEEAIVHDKKCKGRPNHINFKISLSEKKKKNWARETDFTWKWDIWKISILNITTVVAWFQKL